MTLTRVLSRLVSLLRRFLHSLGYDLVRSSRDFRDLRHLSDDPLGALYESGSEPFLLDVRLDRLLALEGLALRCVPGAGNPWVETAASILDGRCADHSGSPLETFYEQWTPENAAEALGLEPSEASRELRRLPPFLAVLPWFPLGLKELEETRVSVIEHENRARGANLGVEHGTILNGPLSPAKCALEFEWLAEITTSIAETGYIEPESAAEHMRGLVLIRGTEWRVLLRNGNHRIAALAAVGKSSASIIITKHEQCPRRSEVESWPHVRSGLFTEQQALQVFDRMFEGRRPTGCPELRA